MIHIYLSPLKRVTLIAKKEVLFKDVAIIEGPSEIVNKINSLRLFYIEENKNKNYLISIMDIIRLIQKMFTDIVIHNLGEAHTIISYKKKMSREYKLLTFLKVIFVSLVLICGGAVAIMTFHTDAQIPNIFNKFYFIIMGDNHSKPHVIEISYALGLATGISMFFNHISKFKFSDDPTPIEVELKLYQQQVDESIIETLKGEKE